MAQGRPRDPRKQQQWQRWIQPWQASGLSVRAFCARHRLAEPRFYAWRRQLRQRQGPGANFETKRGQALFPICKIEKGACPSACPLVCSFLVVLPYWWQCREESCPSPEALTS